MKPSFENYINIKSTVNHSEKWQSIIIQWLENNKLYLIENNFSDSTFWHNEMANISCMVSAIWQRGGVAISEYTTTKGNGKKDYSRADLYFSIDNIQYLVESKFIKENETTKINTAKIKSTMSRARNVCKDIRDENIHNKMALVFVVPYETTPIDLENFPYSIKAMLKMNGSYLEYNGKKYNAVYLFGELC